jgi:regulator of replication initiation timing
MKKTVDNINNFGKSVDEIEHLLEGVDTHQTLIIDNFGALVNEVGHLRDDVNEHTTLIKDLKKTKHEHIKQLHGLNGMFAILQDSVQCLSTDTKKLSIDTQDLKKTFEIGTTYLKVLVKLGKVLSWISGTGLVILSILQILGML